MGFLQLLGRVLIVTALASSAYHHLQRPTLAIEEFKDNYRIVDQLSNTYLSFDLSYDQTNWLMGVRIFGLFEALMCCLIVFGDPLGGVLYLISIKMEIFFLIWPRFVSKNIASWSFVQLQELSHFIALLGIAVILTFGHYNKEKGSVRSKGVKKE